MSLQFLRKLEEIIDSRIREASPESYTYRLVSQGVGKICKKIIEEAGEVAIAALSESNERLLEECADLVYHMLVLLRSKGLSLEDVCKVLEKRHIARTSSVSAEQREK